MKFSYQRYTVIPSPSVPDGIVYRPEVPIRVIGSAGDASFLALVDSGADETVLPRSVGEAIGVEIDDSTQSQIAGIGGQTVGVSYGQVELELTTARKLYRWSAMVAFAAMEPEDTSAILGHAGCINSFRVRFDVERRAVHLEPNGRFSGTVRP